MNILRPTYMRQLIDAQNNGLIKIVSGIRRYLNSPSYEKHRKNTFFCSFICIFAKKIVPLQRILKKQ